VYKIETGVDGAVKRYKARLVAQDFTQNYGIDFDETFVQYKARVFTLSDGSLCTEWLTLDQVNVTTAFLNGTLQEEVYMQQSKGFVCPEKKEHVCKLKKNIYGLKQSPRCWNFTLNGYLKQLGFKQTVSNPCESRRRYAIHWGLCGLHNPASKD